MTDERDILEKLGGVLPGHWNSPYPSADDISRACAVWQSPPERLPDVDLNEARQLELVDLFSEFRSDAPFPSKQEDGWRYYAENKTFPIGDAIVLHSMIRHLRPRRLIEIGVGFSSAITLDTNERFMDNEIDCTFIDPYPQLLLPLLKTDDLERARLLRVPVQEVPLSEFEVLEENDILFIDSSHIMKMGSDVNYLFFEVLPRLSSGVHVQIHDIFYPFEYYASWAEQGWAWTESYILRAFLQYNSAFEISFFNHYLTVFHKEVIKDKLPELLGGGGSIWLRRR